VKLLYITTTNLDEDTGVKKKIFGQIKAIGNSGVEVHLLASQRDRIVLRQEEKVSLLNRYNNRSFLRYFSLRKNLYKLAYTYAVENDFDAIFLRYSLADFFCLRMLRKFKKSSVKIFIEIPSFPYDFEFDSKRWYKKIGLFMDRVLRHKLKKYVDFIFTPSPTEGSIFGVPAYSFDNGVDVDDVSRRQYSGFKKNTLRLIGVANINAWHGYDRIIESIARYYKTKNKINFVFNVVGEGIELPKLKKLAKDLGVKERIVFHGKKYGEELDKLYASSDVAVSSIGFLRIAKSLKSREACLKGIPFIGPEGDPVFDDGFEYVYIIQEDDSTVDLEDIYDWLSKLDPNIYLEEMYNWGKERLGWDKAFSPVINIIKKTVEE
jgi:glycosyltransferase involved in cell wall biosynthesis